MKNFILAALLLAYAPASAQELWLRPEKYFYEAGQEVAVQVQSDNEFIGEVLPLEESVITLFEHWNKQVSNNIKPSYRKEDKASARIRLGKEGSEFVFFRAKQSYELDPEEFHEYLRQYGSEEFIEARTTNGKTGARASISITHHVQLTFRTGKNDAKNWIKPRDFPFEIIPDKNPQTLRRGDRIHFTVIEKGKPVFGARVKIWNRWDNRTTVQNIYTEQDGVVNTTISNPGDWMVTVVRIRKADGGGEEYVADKVTLLFGYR